MSARGGGSATWPKHARLRRRPDFLRVQEQGRRVGGRHFMLFVAPRPAAAVTDAVVGARFGVTVSRKVGKATVRNRVKRYLREGLRRLRGLAPSADLVVVARPGAAAVTQAQVAEEIRQLFGRLAAR